mmetsp:Transcript_10812/g.33595  ORF Transcript_10812/g.33595 Transcript_10812/m.33595 type:complete len:208 (-) Transcript_10812:320-943(-)
MLATHHPGAAAGAVVRSYREERGAVRIRPKGALRAGGGRRRRHRLQQCPRRRAFDHGRHVRRARGHPVRVCDVRVRPAAARRHRAGQAGGAHGAHHAQQRRGRVVAAGHVPHCHGGAHLCAGHVLLRASAAFGALRCGGTAAHRRDGHGICASYGCAGAPPEILYISPRRAAAARRRQLFHLPGRLRARREAQGAALPARFPPEVCR